MHTTQRLRKSGFTLIELLIVVVIIGLLTTIASASYLAAQRNARDDVRKSDMHSIATAVETYYAANKKFPGKIAFDATLNLGSGADTTQNAYDINHMGCEFIDGRTTPHSFSYFYVQGTDCSTIPATVGGNLYNPTDYPVSGSWIPGLSPYLSPFPAYSRYNLGVAAGSVGDMLYTQRMMTYAYRHLDGGFMVYGRLEGTSTDSNFMAGHAPLSGQPQLLNAKPVTPTTDNIYIIRQ